MNLDELTIEDITLLLMWQIGNEDNEGKDSVTSSSSLIDCHHCIFMECLHDLSEFAQIICWHWLFMEVHEIFTSTLPKIVSLALHESHDSSFHDLPLPPIEGVLKSATSAKSRKQPRGSWKSQNILKGEIDFLSAEGGQFWQKSGFFWHHNFAESDPKKEISAKIHPFCRNSYFCRNLIFGRKLKFRLLVDL